MARPAKKQPQQKFEEPDEAEGWEDAVVETDDKDGGASLRLRDWRDVERFREMKELRRLVDDDYGLEEIFHIPVKPRADLGIPVPHTPAGKLGKGAPAPAKPAGKAAVPVKGAPPAKAAAPVKPAAHVNAHAKPAPNAQAKPAHKPAPHKAAPHKAAHKPAKPAVKAKAKRK